MELFIFARFRAREGPVRPRQGLGLLGCPRDMTDLITYFGSPTSGPSKLTSRREKSGET
jgi:hypothetical protein